MHFVPDANVYDPFWMELLPQIKHRLDELPCLQTRQGGHLQCMRQLRRLPNDFLDDHDEPLFGDLDCKLFISSGYSSDALDKLETMGLSYLSTSEIWERINGDLQSGDSKLRARKTSQEWHSSCSRMLLGRLRKTTPKYRQALLEMAMFWMEGGDDLDFQNMAPGSFYWSRNGKAVIPCDLNFSLVNSLVLQNAERKALYEELGVATCPVLKVEKAIRDRYAVVNKISLAQNVSHLKYLFFQIRQKDVSRQIFFFNQAEEAVYRRYVTKGKHVSVVGTSYIPSKQMYSGNQISHRLMSKIEDLGSLTPIHILHDDYFEGWEEQSDFDLWRIWLQERAGAREDPELLTDKGKMTGFFSDILKHLPEESVSIVKSHWLQIELAVEENENIRNSLRKSDVAIRSGELQTLENTWLATPELSVITEQYGISDTFPFLQVDLQLGQRVVQEWRMFNDYLGVGIEATVEFWEQALLQFCITHEESLLNSDHLIEIYERLYSAACYSDHAHLK